MIKSYERLKRQNREKFKLPKTSQDIVNVDTVYKDGIFKKEKKYSKTYKFKDINYSIASKEQKVGMFLDYSDLLNSFDSSVMAKITINNRRINLDEFKEDVLIPFQNDGLDKYRREYNEMLLDKISGMDNIVQEKYITVTVFKNSIEEARSAFSRITNELSGHFAKLGSNLQEINLNERLKILHDFYRSGEEENFMFDLNDFIRRGHNFKDVICPKAPKFYNNYFKFGDKYGRVMFISNYARYIKDNFISELCDQNKNLIYSMDIVTIPTDEAVKEVEKRQLGVETNITNWVRREVA